MVSFKSLVAATTLAIVPSAMAIIDSMTAPASATAGSDITAIMQTSIYVQNWVGYGIIFGLQTSETHASCPNCVGTQIAYTALTGDEGNIFPYNFNQTLNIPAGTATGGYVLVAAIPNLVGASGVIDVTFLTSNITIA